MRSMKGYGLVRIKGLDEMPSVGFAIDDQLFKPGSKPTGAALTTFGPLSFYSKGNE